MKPVGAVSCRQRGAVLLVALSMLLLFTLMLSGSFTLNATNLQVIAHLQGREEALAAASKVIEEVLASDFVGAGLQRFTVDIDNDGHADYQVEVPAARCVRASRVAAVALSSVTLDSLSDALWDTLWLLEAAATQDASGVAVRVQVGVRIRLADAHRQMYCRRAAVP